MNDKNSEEEKDQPPKIKLGGNGNGNGKPKLPSDTSPVSDEEAPPKIKLGGSQSSGEAPVEQQADQKKSAASAQDEEAQASQPEDSKSETARVDLSEADLPDVEERQKNATMKVELLGDDSEAADTSKISKAVDKKKTSKIDLSEVLGSQPDKPKSTATGTAAPKTIRLKRPDTSSTPKSSQKPSGETVTEEGVAKASEGQKAGTAKIDLPDAGETPPPTQRKTIRIKRPEGGGTAGGKTLSVARTEKSGTISTPTSATLSSLSEEDGADEPGMLISLLGIAAMLVAAVVVYILIAQFSSIGMSTDGPSMAFPGRII